MYSFFNYLPTALNPADDPTRGRSVRPPKPLPPKWFQLALSGDFEELDHFLREQRLDPPSLAKVPLFAGKDVPALPSESRRNARRQEFSLSTKRRCAGPSPVKQPLPEHKYSCLLTPDARNLVETIPADQFVFPRGRSRADVFHRQGHLDLFSGWRGGATALADTSQCWVLCFDLKHSPKEDLSDPRVQLFLQRLLQSGLFLSVSAAPVCASFSRAVRPAVRSRASPYGFSGVSSNMQAKVKLGNQLAVWVAAFMTQALHLGIVFWVENPWLSFMWDLHEFQQLACSASVGWFTVDQCRFSTPWRKRTRFLTSCALRDTRTLCQCKGPHIHLKGYCKARRCAWTKLAEAYPAGLCKSLARGVHLSLVQSGGTSNAAASVACSGSEANHIGEAKNPGPALSTQGGLEDVQLVTPATARLQSRVVSAFEDWLAAELSAPCVQAARLCPVLLCHILRAYGNHLFCVNKPAYLYRHLLAFYQKNALHLRPYLPLAWDLLTRWERVNPVRHRTPLAKPVLDAMLSTALGWGWVRWAALTALAFFGLMRPGEPLAGRRQDLLLPTDLLSFDKPILFFRIEKAKTRHRGGGLIQHSKITSGVCVQLCELAFSDLEPTSLLYPASAATYRRRWDAILEALLIPKSASLTPGGLRGGGAVHAYHSGMPLVDLLWSMRLRHLQTLEHYLQEVAAENSLLKLSQPSRSRVIGAARLLPILLAHASASQPAAPLSAIE